MSTLGVVILSLRGMKHLTQSLESVKWADAITVLHAGAGEPSIGGNYFPSLRLRKIASLRELGDPSWEIGTDWVLHLWGEERVEDELGEELRALRRRESSRVPMAYRIPVRSHLLGRWVKGSLLGPSPALRLSRRAEHLPSGWWDSTTEKSREALLLPHGWIGDYAATELNDGIDRLQSVSELWAEEFRGKDHGLNPKAAVLRSFQVFVKMLLMNGIVMNGFAGLTLSTLAAYLVLLTGARAWEASNARTKIKSVG